MLRRPVEPGQYVSIRYSERLAEAGIEPIGYIPPAKAEANYWRRQQGQVAATEHRAATAAQEVEP